MLFAFLVAGALSFFIGSVGLTGDFASFVMGLSSAGGLAVSLDRPKAEPSANGLVLSSISSQLMLYPNVGFGSSTGTAAGEMKEPAWGRNCKHAHKPTRWGNFIFFV